MRKYLSYAMKFDSFVQSLAYYRKNKSLQVEAKILVGFSLHVCEGKLCKTFGFP
jgi:hypothetical protein